jgi:hypothetical protein
MQEQKRHFTVDYGQNHEFANVTLQALRTCVHFDDDQKQLVLELPECDGDRARLLGDPKHGVVKVVMVHADKKMRACPKGERVKIPLHEGDIFIDSYLRLRNIASASPLLRKCGVPAENDNFVQQMLCMLFVEPRACVAHIGSKDAGVTSFMLAQILVEPWNQLVVLDHDKAQCESILNNQLLDADNRSIMGVRIGQFAVSDTPLIQIQNGRILEMKPGLTWNHKTDTPLPCKTFREICDFFETRFDTLVLSGKGIFFRLLQNNVPDTWRYINLIIMTHDYDNQEDRAEVVRLLTLIGFKSMYQHLEGQTIVFHEVWIRDTPVMLHYAPPTSNVTHEIKT